MPFRRNAYDHRLRELVCRTRDLDLAARRGVPRSTARSWLRRGARPVVGADVLDEDVDELRVRVLVRMAGLRLDSKRLPDGEQKQCNKPMESS